MRKIAVLGAGSWGTSLAGLLADKGYEVSLWARNPELCEQIRTHHENLTYLPGFTLSTNLTATSDLELACKDREVVLLVPPSQALRHILEGARAHISKNALVISASKGIENGTLLPMSEVLQQALPHMDPRQFCYLSGPSFAREVSAGMPTAVVAASTSNQVAQQVQDLFSTEAFRVYTSDDVMGVELGGALKNVIALAAGVCEGLGFGSNSQAALITRGLAEITRLGCAMGAQATTFAGLAGMGDLVLTCTGSLSRNRSVGIELGRGRSLESILGEMQMVAEGVKTSLSAYQLAQKQAVDVPIINQIYRILYEKKDPRQAVIDLMQRELKAEGA